MVEIKSNHNHYIIDNLAYDRVTSVLDFVPSPQLEAWKARVGLVLANKKMRQSANNGTKVHAYIAEDMRNVLNKTPRKLKVPKAIEGYVAAYEKWKWKISLKPVVVKGVEVTVWDKVYRYAGTFDLVAMIGDEWWLIDFKTSAKVWPEHIYQLHAYVPLAEDLYGPIRNVMIVRLDSNIADYDDHHKMKYNHNIYRGFLGLLKFYKCHNEHFTLKEDGDGREKTEVKDGLANREDRPF